MKKSLLITGILVTILFISCLKEDDFKDVVIIGTPELSTTIVDNVKYTTARLGSEVLSNPKWKYKVDERGFVWSKKTNPIYTENEGKKVNAEVGFGSFETDIIELDPGATYYARSYAKSGKNIGYGEEVSFTTTIGILPTVTIGVVTDISYTRAKVSGEVVSKGSESVTERGFVWSTTSNPTYSKNVGKSSNGNEIGTFSNNITGLTHNTKYYVKAYAKSEIGIGYSEEVSFTTAMGVLPTVIIGVVADISYNIAEVSGEVVSKGSSPVAERGFVWSTTSNPTYSENVGKSSNGSEIGTFSNNITGLTHNTKYYIKAYAKSEIGISYSEEISFSTLEYKAKITINLKSVSFDMIVVDGGTFQMGAGNGGGDITPIHSVTLSDYYIGNTEVTQALWEAVMGSNPSDNKGSTLPVEKVSWKDCQEFIKKLNTATGKTFRLPTEAEWEYAAKGGNKSKGYKYSGSNDLNSVAWNTSNSGDNTHAVGTKSANELGIYDMSGNVYEWCSDWYGAYGSNAQTNPIGPASGSLRVRRGGGWYIYTETCRVAYRNGLEPELGSSDIGLRLVFVP